MSQRLFGTLSTDDFLQQQCDAYRAQLSLYAQTLAQLQADRTNKNEDENSIKSTTKLKAALYFPLLSHLEVVIDQ